MNRTHIRTLSELGDTVCEIISLQRGKKSSSELVKSSDRVVPQLITANLFNNMLLPADQRGH